MSYLSKYAHWISVDIYPLSDVRTSYKQFHTEVYKQHAREHVKLVKWSQHLSQVDVNDKYPKEAILVTRLPEAFDLQKCGSGRASVR